mmetsp:Transcript_15976/g.44798  ORF Transcript_15976/g.44798 Transcript_15976/m.44798 type:complete len:238 (+) Transcript_15976:361-1074(+)
MIQNGRFHDQILTNGHVPPSVVQHVRSRRHHLIFADALSQPTVVVVTPGSIFAQGVSGVVTPSETTVMIADRVAIVNGFLIFIPAREHVGEVQAFEWEVDQRCDLVASVRGRREMESLQVNDQNGRCSVQMELLPSSNMLLAAIAVPHLGVLQLLHLAVLLNAVLHRDFLVLDRGLSTTIFHRCRVFLLGFVACQVEMVVEKIRRKFKRNRAFFTDNFADHLLLLGVGGDGKRVAIH